VKIILSDITETTSSEINQMDTQSSKPKFTFPILKNWINLEKMDNLRHVQAVSRTKWSKVKIVVWDISWKKLLTAKLFLEKVQFYTKSSYFFPGFEIDTL